MVTNVSQEKIYKDLLQTIMEEIHYIISLNMVPKVIACDPLYHKTFNEAIYHMHSSIYSNGFQSNLCNIAGYTLAVIVHDHSLFKGIHVLAGIPSAN